MAHQRKLIRDAIVLRLLQAGTLAERRVFGSRAAPLQPKELPALLVYTKSEQVEISNVAPQEFKRTLTVSLELVAQSDREETLDDLLDEFAFQVEKSIFSDQYFDDLVSECVLGDTDIEILSDGEKPIGAVKINLLITYFQRLPADDSSDGFDDFLKIGTKVDLPTADGSFENDDLVDIPQS